MGEWYDLPVDLIITPMRIINISEKLPKPSQGIEWRSITMEMIQEMPILQTLKKLKFTIASNHYLFNRVAGYICSRGTYLYFMMIVTKPLLYFIRTSRNIVVITL